MRKQNHGITMGPLQRGVYVELGRLASFILLSIHFNPSIRRLFTLSREGYIYLLILTCVPVSICACARSSSSVRISASCCACSLPPRYIRINWGRLFKTRRYSDDGQTKRRKGCLFLDIAACTSPGKRGVKVSGLTLTHSARVGM